MLMCKLCRALTLAAFILQAFTTHADPVASTEASYPDRKGQGTSEGAVGDVEEELKTWKVRVQEPAPMWCANHTSRDQSTDPDIHLINQKNFLFWTETSYCGCGRWDNTPWTMFSRIFLPLVLLGSSCFLVLVSRPSSKFSIVGQSIAESEAESGRPGESEQKPKHERIYALDYARVMCITAVVVEHSGGRYSYSVHNWMLALNWVLPYLYLVSGFSAMFSSARLWMYNLKLIIVFVIGVGANCVGLAVARQPINFAVAMYQMAYVLILMLLSVLTHPLKKALQARCATPSKRPERGLLFLALSGGVLTFGLVMFCGAWTIFDLESEFAKSMLNNGGRAFIFHFPLVLCIWAGLMFVALLALQVGNSGLIPWVMLFLMYVIRMVIPHARGDAQGNGHPANADLYMLGLVLAKVPFANTVTVQSVIRGYWPLFLLIFFMGMPWSYGRCDLHPMNTIYERFRFWSIEIFLVVTLASGAANTSDKYHVLGWLNQWALYAYVFHMAWALMSEHWFGTAAWGCLFTLLGVPFFALINRVQKRKKKVGKDQHQGEEQSHEEGQQPGQKLDEEQQNARE